MATRVAVVTGGNKGIGFAIVRGLCKKFQGDVFLTARSEERGLAAVDELKKEGLTAKFHKLDIDEIKDAIALKEFLISNYGGLDLLVNNAGIAYKGNATEPFSEQAEVTNKTNFFSLIMLCDTLFPILKPHARVVHLSSRVSVMGFNKSKENIKQAFRNAKTIDDVKTLVTDFVKSTKDSDFEEKGWPSTAYGVSKMGVSCITPIQQKEFDNNKKDDIVVNSCCPGFVDTDMTGHKGKLTIDEGAITPIWLSLLEPNIESPRGEFCADCKILNWMNTEFKMG